MNLTQRDKQYKSQTLLLVMLNRKSLELTSQIQPHHHMCNETTIQATAMRHTKLEEQYENH